MTKISSSLAAYECLTAQINPNAEEVWILALNAQLTLIEKQMVFRGTADSCIIHPRDIFRILILCNACTFILAHNHPSKQHLPSRQDLDVTRNFYTLSHLLQIPLVDHLILTEMSYYSMADQGWLKKWRSKGKKTIIELG